MRLGSCAVVAFSFGACAVVATAQPRADTLGPRTLMTHHVLCTDTPVSALPLPALHIGAAYHPESRQHLTQGDVAVIPGGTGAGLAVGQRFVARHVQGGINPFPLHQKGYAAVRTSGILTVTAVDDAFGFAAVDYSCDALTIGDYLEPLTEVPVPVAAPATGTLDFGEIAHVLFGVDRRELMGDGDVLNFDLGTNSGVVAGTRVTIFRDRLDGMPLVAVGEAVVVEPAADHSKAVIVSVQDAIYSGDLVVVRRP